MPASECRIKTNKNITASEIGCALGRPSLRRRLAFKHAISAKVMQEQPGMACHLFNSFRNFIERPQKRYWYYKPRLLRYSTFLPRQVPTLCREDATLTPAPAVKTSIMERLPLGVRWGFEAAYESARIHRPIGTSKHTPIGL